MSHDFAKIRPEPLLERKPVETPPAWSLMVTGVVVGITIGVFACVLVYLSGNVPPLNTNTPLPVSQVSALETQADSNAEPEAELQLEFYSALSEYEVAVDAIPVTLADDPDSEGGEQISTEDFEVADTPDEDLGSRQLTLGLDVVVRQQDLLGRTLFLVQSGPYTDGRRLSEAETLLRRSNIPSLRMSLQ